MFWSPFTRLMCIISALMYPGCFSTRTVLNSPPNDGTISSEVEAKLAGDQLSSLSGVIVTTEGGIVTLVGSVPTAEQKARAADLARQVKGVKRVKNDLDIRGAAAE